MLAAASLSVSNRTLLMVDDYETLYKAGLARHLEPLRRVHPGVPAIAPTEPWESLLGTWENLISTDKQWHHRYFSG